MIFGIKEKLIIFIFVFLDIATNIAVLLMTAFVLQGNIYPGHNLLRKLNIYIFLNHKI